VRLSDKAYQLIRHKIITLQLAPRTAIDEQALMEDLQLGRTPIREALRTPIREALQRLAAEGLVRVAPRRGMFVADISITDLQKIFEMRVVLEGLCARLAAERVTEAQLAAMEDLVDRLDRTAETDLLADTLRRLLAQSFRIWYLVLDRLNGVRAAMEQHVAITKALEARDGVLAETIVQEHISEFQQQIKAAL